MTIDLLPLPRLVKVGPSLVERLAILRRELEEADDLVNMELSAALLLSDVCAALGLGPHERREVLGEKAEADIEVYLDSRIPFTLTETESAPGDGAQ